MTRMPAATDPARKRPAVWLPAAILIAIVVVLAAWLWLQRDHLGPAPGVTPSAVGPGTPAALVTTGVFIEPEDGRGPILDEIAAARRTIDLEMYLVTDEPVLQALEAAHARGVAVRVILEQHPFGGEGGQPEIFARLEEAGIAVRWGNPVFRFTHIKAMIVDDAVAIILNQNLTASSFTTNRDFGAITTAPAAVRTAAAIFAADWERGGEPPPQPLVVSPTNARAELTGLIDGTRDSVDIYAEVLRDPELLAKIVAAAERGVRVRLVVSPSEDFARELAELAAGGVAVRYSRTLYIHAKVIIADGERAFLGSQNLSATSLDLNRELGIIVDDPVSLARLSRTFELDFRAGSPPEDR